LTYRIQPIIRRAMKLVERSPRISAFDLRGPELSVHRLFLKRQIYHCQSLHLKADATPPLMDIAEAFKEVNSSVGVASALHSAMLGALLRSNFEELSRLLLTDEGKLKDVFYEGSRWVYYSALGAKSHLHAHWGQRPQTENYYKRAIRGVIEHGLIPPLTYYAQKSFGFVLGRTHMRRAQIPLHDRSPVAKNEIYRAVKYLSEIAC
jgi:hypothetical protein